MPTVTFTTAGATVDSYRNFIQALRALLESGEESHGIPVTRGRSTVRDSQRFVLVELSNRASSSDSPVTLAVDVTNSYVVGYRTEVGPRFFFFPEVPKRLLDYLFPGTQRYTLPSSGSYIDLQNLANDRRKIELGMGPLDNAISLLRISYMGPQRLREQRQKAQRRIAQSGIARSLIVVIQMVAEASRFKYIEVQVAERIPTAVFCPTPTMLSYENSWKKLSKAIQQSNQGVFLNPVQVTDQHGASRNVENINDVAIQDLAIMLFIPKSISDSKPRRVQYVRICAFGIQNQNQNQTERAHQNLTENDLLLIIVILILLCAFGVVDNIKAVAIVGLLLLMLMWAIRQQM